MVFCDISRAFDRVRHKGLLIKLEQNGIEGNLLRWLSNYYKDKHFFVSNVFKSCTTQGNLKSGLHDERLRGYEGHLENVIEFFSSSDQGELLQSLTICRCLLTVFLGHKVLS